MKFIFTFVTALCLMGSCCFANTAATSNLALTGFVPQEILETLPEIQELKPTLYKNKIEHGQECVYELFTRHDNLGWNAVIADIIESVPHYHKRTTEVYTVLNGTLEVFINGQSHVLNPGDTILVPVRSIHWARSLTDKPARIMCTCVPAWSPEDHHIVQ